MHKIVHVRLRAVVSLGKDGRDVCLEMMVRFILHGLRFFFFLFFVLNYCIQ